ncbi:MepB family protein [Flavobacterium sp. PL12]|uniref:MepB family protein n=1 Tax=Flavobacterium sp. PL12 TaxID=3071718 RepID=UPI00319E0868
MSWKTVPTIQADLLLAKELLYDSCGFECSLPKKEKESAEYGAYSFQLKNKSIVFRVAKITPTKIGQFVTLWKRNGKGPIQPLDFTDTIDFIVISVRKENCVGQFVFPKSVLCEKGIISTTTKEGKRAIRVYPPWDEAINKQAQKTQKWQLDYFLEIPSDETVNIEDAKRLYDLYN